MCSCEHDVRCDERAAAETAGLPPRSEPDSSSSAVFDVRVARWAVYVFRPSERHNVRVLVRWRRIAFDHELARVAWHREHESNGQQHVVAGLANVDVCGDA